MQRLPVRHVVRDVKSAITHPAPVVVEGRKRKCPESPASERSGGSVDSDGVDLQEVYELLGDSSEASQFNMVPRKRERLTNLSAEEKLNRRKMKNRVAAQSARDRKKERTGRLESVVRHLLSETKYLRAENRSLRLENERLQRQQHYQPVSGDNSIKQIVVDKREPLSSAEVSSSEVEMEKGGLASGASVMSTLEPAEFIYRFPQRIGVVSSASALTNRPSPIKQTTSSSNINRIQLSPTEKSLLTKRLLKQMLFTLMATLFPASSAAVKSTCKLSSPIFSKAPMLASLTSTNSVRILC